MSVALKFFGWVLTGGAVLFLVMLAVALAENSEKSRGALPGIIFFVVVTAVPGLLLLRKGGAAKRKEELESFVVATDRFTLAEAAKRIKASETETEKCVLEIAARRRIDLVFDGERRRFYRRGSIKRVQAVETRCPSCGAKLGSLVLEPGETARCQYCNEPIRVA